jgi:hypothetical protein
VPFEARARTTASWADVKTKLNFYKKEGLDGTFHNMGVIIWILYTKWGHFHTDDGTLVSRIMGDSTDSELQ